jgi:hypothetical protein
VVFVRLRSWSPAPRALSLHLVARFASFTTTVATALLLAACGDAIDSDDEDCGTGCSAGEGGSTAADSPSDELGTGVERVEFGACDGYATHVVDVAYGPDAGFGQDAMPDVVLGPPHGGGATQGSLDVVALGNGGSITLGLGAQRIVDGPGPDFTVFENVFYAGGDTSAPFAEIAEVQVSDDGETWTAFPCTAIELPYEGCAGWHPTYAGPGDDEADPHDPAVSGGDSFDLATLGLTEARFVRIVDRADLTGFRGSFDLDAVALVHFDCDAP